MVQLCEQQLPGTVKPRASAQILNHQQKWGCHGSKSMLQAWLTLEANCMFLTSWQAKHVSCAKRCMRPHRTDGCPEMPLTSIGSSHTFRHKNEDSPKVYDLPSSNIDTTTPLPVKPFFQTGRTLMSTPTGPPVWPSLSWMIQLNYYSWLSNDCQ